MGVRERDVRIRASGYAVFPILVGGAIYLVCRPETLLVFSWADNVGLSPFIALAREHLGWLCDEAPSWIIFNLPNGMWAFSLFAVIKVIWGTRAPEAMFWLLLAFVFTFGLEIGQAISLVPGTFDPADLYAMLTGAIIALIIVRSNGVEG